MQKSYRFIISALFLGAYLLSACSGVVVPQQDDSSQSPSGSSQSTDAVFTGTIESMDGTQWLISGQLVSVDDATSVDPNVQVGDIVKVEASVSPDGSVIALKIETSGPDDVNANDTVGNDNASNANDDNANANVNDNTNSANDNSNTNSNANSNDAVGVVQEVYGTVESITADSITIGGVTYSLADITEFKNFIAVGDQVKVHVIVNADGTFTIREIEKSSGTGVTTNSNGNDDNGNVSNSNDDNGGGSNSNDDNGGGSNSNDDNGSGGNGNGNG